MPGVIGDVTVALDGFDKAFKSWDGMMGKNMRGRAEGLKTRAVADAPYRTGELKRAITTWYGTSGGELEARVGANPAPPASLRGYGYFMHEGTKPHVIRPVRARALKFRVGGRVVYAAVVRHPGTRPRPYLTRWLPEAVR